MKNTLLILACSIVMTAWAQTPRLQSSKQQHKKQTIFLPQTEIEKFWNSRDNRWDTLVVYKVTYQNGLRTVDSSYNYRQNPSGSSTMNYYSYNAARRLTQEIQLKINLNGDIDTSSITYYTYNAQGNQTGYINLAHNPFENRFDTSYATRTNFVYDTQNRIIQFEESRWERDSNDFIVDGQTKLFYTGNQQAPDSAVISFYDIDEFVPEFAARLSFIDWNRFELFDGSKSDNYTMYEYNGVDFDKMAEVTFEYNTQGDLVKQLSLSVSGDTTDYTINEYTYNSDGAMTSVTFKFWDEGVMRNSMRYLYSNFFAFTGSKKQLTVNFVIYPNPTNDQLHINGIVGEALCSIFSINGKQMLSQTLNETKQNIDVSSLPAGVYFVTIKQNDLVERKKFVISR